MSGHGLGPNGLRPAPELEASARRFECDASDGVFEALSVEPFSWFHASCEEDQEGGNVLSMHDWGFAEVQAFLQERPMSQYVECFEIVDGRVLSVLTDETLLELGVSKRLHRLVLINKIGKEKARSQQHAALHTALTRLVLHMLQGGEADDRKAEALNRRVNELVGCLPPQELALELKAKVQHGGAVCELLLHAFAYAYLSQPKVALFADEDVVSLLVDRFKDIPKMEILRRVNTLRTLFLLLRVEDNQAAAVKSNLIPAVLEFMESEVRTKTVQVLSLAVLLALSHNAANQGTIVTCGGIKHVVQAVKENIASYSTLEQGFGLLWLFAQDATNIDIIVELGTVAALMAGMSEHRKRAGVQENGCGLICALCYKVLVSIFAMTTYFKYENMSCMLVGRLMGMD